MRGWKGLEVVETIYEEDHEEDGDGDEDEDGSSSVFLSPTPTPTPPRSFSSPMPLQSLESSVEAWSKATGCKTDVVVRVQDQCFHLHRDPLKSRSRYLRRKLTESSSVTVTTPSGIMAETFADAVRFCYGIDVALTPSNLAAMWVTAEWMEMTAGDGQSLVQLTEDYFRREVAGDCSRAGVVLRTCMGLLGGATEAAAGLVVRCVAAAATGGGGGWLEDMVGISEKEFRIVAELMGEWSVHDHDLLYRIVDYYLENHNGKLTEEEKTRICCTINCTKLSHPLLVHLVQNPKLPLRFVVQAMLVDQLNNHHSVLNIPAAAAAAHKPHPTITAGESSLTLGAILQRDAALRQVTHLRATMEATTSRIESLERDLAGLRRRLRLDVEEKRSESFHFVGREEGDVAVAEASGRACNGKSFGWKVVHGLKSMFGTTTAVEIKAERRPTGGHRRNRSFA